MKIKFDSDVKLPLNKNDRNSNHGNSSNFLTCMFT